MPCYYDNTHVMMFSTNFRSRSIVFCGSGRVSTVVVEPWSLSARRWLRSEKWKVTRERERDRWHCDCSSILLLLLLWSSDHNCLADHRKCCCLCWSDHLCWWWLGGQQMTCRAGKLSAEVSSCLLKSFTFLTTTPSCYQPHLKSQHFWYQPH